MSNPERRHHSYSPSTLQMREACPLWSPTGETNEKAELGSRQHKFTEDRHDDGSLSDESWMHAVECLEYAGKIKQDLILRAGDGATVDELTEVYLPLDDRRWTVSVFNPETYKTDLVSEDCTTGGYVDRLILVPALKHIEMFDWKFGRWPVTKAEDNLQGISYVLGAFRKWKWAQTITLHFKQPQISATSTHTFRRDEYDTLLLRVKVVVERAAAAAKLENYATDSNPTVPSCLFCGRIGRCLRIHDMIIKIGDKFYPAGMPKNLDPTALDSPENVAEGLRVAQIVEAWAAGFRRQKTLQVLSGRAPVPEGYRIMEFEKRQIKSTFRLLRRMRQYLSAKEIRALLFKPSITKLERAISDKFPRGQKTKQLEILGQQLLDSGAVEMAKPTPYLGAIPKKKEQTNETD